MLRTTLIAASALCVFAQNTVTNVTTNGSAMRVVAQNGVAYIADSNSLTIANTQRMLGSLAMGGVVRDVAVSGTTAYTVGAGGLIAVNVATPANPTRGSAYTTLTTGQRLAVSGNYAYIAAGSAGLVIVDVRTMTRTAQYRRGASPNVVGVTVSGNYTYITDYVSGLLVINTATITAPTFVSQISVPNAFAVEVSGNTAYVASYTSGLYTIDLTNKIVPVRLSIFPISSNVLGLSVNGTTVAVAATSLYFVNLADSVRPVGSQYALGTGNVANDVAVEGTTAFIAGNTAGLLVISNGVTTPPPATPAPLTTPRAPGSKSSSSDDDLSETVIAVIVVSCVAFVAVIATIVVILTAPSNAVETAEDEEQENNEPIDKEEA